jgi:hypothetical protein
MCSMVTVMELAVVMTTSTIKRLYSLVLVVFNLPGFGPFPLLIKPGVFFVTPFLFGCCVFRVIAQQTGGADSRPTLMC